MSDQNQDEKIILDREQILNLLPHGPTKCFLTGVTYLAERSINAFHIVTEENCKDHFKDEVGISVFKMGDIIDAIAQTGLLWLKLQTDGKFQEFKDRIGILNGEYRGKQNLLVLPGDRLCIKLKVIELKRDLFDDQLVGVAEGKASINNQTVHEFVFAFTLQTIDWLKKLVRVTLKRRERERKKIS